MIDEIDIPIGLIPGLLYRRSEVPPKYAICDGNNGTPDLSHLNEMRLNEVYWHVMKVEK
ncbi:hypothetical protein M0R72_15800 [Candidatus Pacearchaeota archaeon]|jgi:hypothetical protein|nr:hypothetical protein [Candidatus Pacearchaeota archaeon]